VSRRRYRRRRCGPHFAGVLVAERGILRRQRPMMALDGGARRDWRRFLARGAATLKAVPPSNGRMPVVITWISTPSDHVTTGGALSPAGAWGHEPAPLITHARQRADDRSELNRFFIGSVRQAEVGTLAPWLIKTLDVLTSHARCPCNARGRAHRRSRGRSRRCRPAGQWAESTPRRLPVEYSITMNATPSASSTSWMVQMCGWLSADAAHFPGVASA
jgi:hypothetical protein